MTDNEHDSDAESDPVSDGTVHSAADPPSQAQSVSDPAKVVGKFNDPNGGVGVYGWNTALFGNTTGVKGLVDSPDSGAAGVYGEARASSGTNPGVHGVTASSAGNGVYGQAYRTTGNATGVIGQTASADGYGVHSIGRLHAQRDVSQTGATNMNRHVATFHNTSGDSTGDILGLKTDVDNPEEFMNFISFIDADEQVGQIDGNGSGGVNYKSATADIAEYLPKADPDAAFEAGDVVGLRAGELVADPTAGDDALVISGAPMVTGNVPMNDDDHDMACVALLGQVEVRVAAAVSAGDRLVATPAGTAVAMDDSDGQAPLVGRALEAGDADETVETFVTAQAADGAAPTSTMVEQRHGDEDGRIRELEAENEALRERVAVIEDQLGLDGTSGQPTPADD